MATPYAAVALNGSAFTAFEHLDRLVVAAVVDRHLAKLDARSRIAASVTGLAEYDSVIITGADATHTIANGIHRVTNINPGAKNVRVGGGEILRRGPATKRQEP